MTHALEEVAQLADSLVLIEAGRVVAAGPLAEIAARAELPLARRDDAGAVLAAAWPRMMPREQLTRLEGGGAALLVPLVDAPVGTDVAHPHPGARGDPGRQAPEAISVHNIIPGKARNRGGRAAACGPGGGRPPMARCCRRVTPDAVVGWGFTRKPVLALIKSTAIEVLGS